MERKRLLKRVSLELRSNAATSETSTERGPPTKTKKKVDKDELIFEIEKKLKGHRRFDVPAFDLRVWMLGNGVKTQALSSLANLKKLNKKVRVWA